MLSNWKQVIFFTACALVLILAVVLRLYSPLFSLTPKGPETPEQVMRALEATEPLHGNPLSLTRLTQADVEAFASQPFYEGAAEGDWVVRFADEVLLYRPSTNTILRRWSTGSLPATVL